EKNLRIPRTPDGTSMFEWLDAETKAKGMTVWSLFPRDTKYFANSTANFMVNYRVDNLDELLEEMKQAGVTIDPKREDHEYGRFAWITDPDGNRIELWEPPKE
ncbi:MAG TPA: VOC family protein, partial [Terriglobales bacterium]|nr:VOC family protein [Terriglobales bacterium]